MASRVAASTPGVPSSRARGHLASASWFRRRREGVPRNAPISDDGELIDERRVRRRLRAIFAHPARGRGAGWPLHPVRRAGARVRARALRALDGSDHEHPFRFDRALERERFDHVLSGDHTLIPTAASSPRPMPGHSSSEAHRLEIAFESAIRKGAHVPSHRIPKHLRERVPATMPPCIERERNWKVRPSSVSVRMEPHPRTSFPARDARAQSRCWSASRCGNRRVSVSKRAPRRIAARHPSPPCARTPRPVPRMTACPHPRRRRPQTCAADLEATKVAWSG